MDKDDFRHIIDNINWSYIAKSLVHGHGLFADRYIPSGSLLGVLDGQVMNWKEYDELCDSLSLNPQMRRSLFMEWNALDNNTLLVRPIRTKYSFINHSRTPNCVIMYYPIRIVALNDIEAHQELYLDYRKEPLCDDYLSGHGKTFL